MKRWLMGLVALVAVRAALAGAAPPDGERAMVVRLLGDLASTDREVAERAADQLKQHATLAGPLLGQRLKDPQLANWPLAMATLAAIAPAEVERLEAQLGKAKPDLTARFHLWRLTTARCPSWQRYEPFGQPGSAAEHAGPHLRAIAELGEAAEPQLLRDLEHPGLRLAATYAVGTLKLASAAKPLVKQVATTRVFAGGGRTGPPDRAFSLAAAALAHLGDDGRRLLLDELRGIRMTIAGAALADAREKADLILECLAHTRRTEDVSEVLLRLVDSDDQAVRAWALSKMLPPEPSAPRQERALIDVARLYDYRLKVPAEKLIPILDENEAGTDRPSEAATYAARALVGRLDEPGVADAWATQIERGRFLELFLKQHAYLRSDHTAGDTSWLIAQSPRLKPAAGALLRDQDRLARLDPESRRRAVCLLGQLCYAPRGRSMDSDGSFSPLFRDFLLGHSDVGVRAEAARSIGRIAEWKLRGQAFAILAEAIETELARPEVGRDATSAEALMTAVVHIPHTFARNPVPLLVRVAQSQVHASAREAAAWRLGRCGDLDGARAATMACGPGLDARGSRWLAQRSPTTLDFGFHLLPGAIEWVNRGDEEEDGGAANAAFACAIARLVAEPGGLRRSDRRWSYVAPDRESAHLALLAARHAAPGMVRLLAILKAKHWTHWRDVHKSIRVLQLPETIPSLLGALAARNPYARDSLPYFTLEPEHYDWLQEQAAAGDREVLRLLGRTDSDDAAECQRRWGGQPAEREVRRAERLLGLGGEGDAGRRRSSMPRPKEFAFAVLLQMGEPAVTPMIEALSDPAWPAAHLRLDGRWYRARLARALGEVGDERAVPILKLWGASTERTESEAALEALCAIGTEKARDAVAEIVNAGWRGPVPAGFAGAFKDDPRAAPLLLQLAERWDARAACLAARLTHEPEKTRQQLHDLLERETKRGSEYDRRRSLVLALALLGDKRVVRRALPCVYPALEWTIDGVLIRWEYDAVARLDPEVAAAYLADGIKPGSHWDTARHRRVLDDFLAKEPEPEPRPWQDASSRAGELASALWTLARMNDPGIVRELRTSLAERFPERDIIKALTLNRTDEAVQALIDWMVEPRHHAELTRRTYWRILEALRIIGSARAMATYKECLYRDLVGNDAPRSRAALQWLAETDRDGLREKLLELAGSRKPVLRCVALYGLMKHFGYRGRYDPFAAGKELAQMAAELGARMRRKP